MIKTVYDPEIPVNIYELGLIYRIDLPGDGTCNIDMTSICRLYGSRCISCCIYG